MNNAAFLTRLIEAYQPRQEDAIKLWWHGAQVIIDINGERWCDITLDGVLTQVKQSLAIRYLDQIEMNNPKTN